MTTLLARAHAPTSHPDALGDITLVELAELRLTGPGKRPTADQLSELILRLQDQAHIGQLSLIKRVTRLPARPIPLHYLWEIGENDHYRVDPSFTGKSRFEVYEHRMGPTPHADAVAITFPPDYVELVVTAQAARNLYELDAENWSDAALRWCNAKKHLSLQEELSRLGVPMTIEEVEGLKNDQCRKRDLRDEITAWLETSGHPQLSFDRIMLKKTSDLYPWVKLADTEKQGFCYRPLLKRLFEIMLPAKVGRSKIHVVRDDRWQG